MDEKIKRIKAHIKRHEVLYSIGVTSVVIATITALIMRDESGWKLANRRHQPKETSDTQSLGLISFSDIHDSFNNLSVNVGKEGPGHPGYITCCDECDLCYETQGNAAAQHSTSPKRMSDHINHKLDDIDGHHLRRLEIAS